MPTRSPCSRVTPALSMATSVPELMARPTSAAASAGRVVDPVAGEGHHPALGPESVDDLALAVRKHLRLDAVMPSSRATAWAVTWLSPVSMTTSMPSWRSAASASGVLSLTRSAIPITPAARPSTPTNTAVAPSAAQPVGLVGQGPGLARLRRRGSRRCRPRPGGPRRCRERPCPRAPRSR